MDQLLKAFYEDYFSHLKEKVMWSKMMLFYQDKNVYIPSPSVYFTLLIGIPHVKKTHFCVY